MVTFTGIIMYINSHMTRMMKIALFILGGYLTAGVTPENGAILNYTQVFFKWNQIQSVESYQFTIQEMGTGEEVQLNVLHNSINLAQNVLNIRICFRDLSFSRSSLTSW